MALRHGTATIAVPVYAQTLCDDGEVAQLMAVQCAGIARKSIWDVAEDLQTGRLVGMLPNRALATSPLSLLLGLVALLWLTSAWTIMLGILLAVLCVVMSKHAPNVPPAVKSSPWLIFIVVMVVYVSIASGWQGDQRAKRIVDGQGKFVATVSIEGGAVEGLSYIGRLGDTYAFWDPAGKAVVPLAGSDLKRITIGRRGAGDSSKSR